MILNISADFPDAFNRSKTPAVLQLLEPIGQRHFVVSINRTSNPFKESLCPFEGGIAIRYFALPYGVFLRLFLRRLTKQILLQLGDTCSFSHIVAHKFTVEGIIAFELSKSLRIPYSCSLWGATDRRIIKLKPSYSRLYYSIYHGAKNVFASSPWISRFFSNRFGQRRDGVQLLPIVTRNTSFRDSNPIPNLICTAFNLNLFKLKGLPTLLMAMKLVNPNVCLHIFGGGSTQSVKMITRLIQRHNLEGRVVLQGKVSNELMVERFSRYSCFVLPTTMETFGMVYIEALCGGTPIIYSKNQGIDGYFDGMSIGVSVTPGDQIELASAIDRICSEQSRFQSEVALLKSSGGLDRFSSSEIRKIFEAAL